MKNTLSILTLAVALLGLGVVGVVVQSIFRLRALKSRLAELRKENYETSKMLVRKDAELTAANTRMAALEASKSEFISVTAHQLRTPLTGIRWTFNSLLDRELGDLTPEQEKVVDDGLKSSVRMIALINDLLNVARIEEGRFGFNLVRKSVGALMERVADGVRRLMESKGIMLFLDIASNLPPADIDEEKLAIGLQNVLDNAMKYTPPGGKILVNVSQADNSIKIVISDTGIGIPRTQLERLFGKFFRGDNALRFQTSGSGLGLYVAKNIIANHHGTISVDSVESQGTTATITIPVPAQDTEVKD